MAFENAAVAIDAPEGVGNGDAGVGPAGGAAEVAEADEIFSLAQARGGVGENSLGCLRVLDVDHPLREEGGDVHVAAGGAEKHLGVAHPAESLVALGTVGGDGEEVVLLRPEAVEPEAVDAGVGAFESAGVERCGADDAAGEIIQGGFAGEPGDFDVLEAVESEVWLESFVAAFADVGVGGFGAAEVFGVEGTIGVEAFAVADGDAGAGAGRLR